MRIGSFNANFAPTVSRSHSSANASSLLPQDGFHSMIEPPPPGYNPSAPVPGGKWILGATAAVAGGALGYFAGSQGNAVAGVVAGAITGGVALGTVGIMKDLGSWGGSHRAQPLLLGGLALGAVGGGVVGSLCHSPVAGLILGASTAITAGLATVAFADEHRG